MGREDVVAVRWFFELRNTWRQAARIVAEAVRELYPEAEVYVIGSVAEGRFTAFSDLDILVVLPHDPTPEERVRIKLEIMRRAFDKGLPLDYPVDLHVAGPRRARVYMAYARRVVKLA
jgi:predicted nucleotidyltransferase